jgi:hypothetical protein
LKFSLFQEEEGSLDIHIKEEDIEDIGDVQDIEESEEEDLTVEKIQMHISDLTEEIGKVSKETRKEFCTKLTTGANVALSSLWKHFR